MRDLNYWVEPLHLAPHQEGGFYRETYRAAQGRPARGPFRAIATRQSLTR